VDGEPSKIAERVAAEVDEGGCAAIICNTVSRAQEAYEAMIDHLPDQEVVLVHSRFIGPHRMALERRLRDELGPPSSESQRPERLVVVGTQVLEQSLDIDVDLMVTDMAPVDLILQRSGRLHRHDRPLAARPSRLRVARLLIAGVQGD
ncbi:CRISPR-associated helicase Cas3', partial [Raoultella terrigena]|uniref:CRISPR-associated helicase Cas3' n=1 Tax=Raoultella terrigena TaxID=577 RepID=UPI00133083E2